MNITINQLVSRVQETAPEFNRAKLTSFQQRHRLPRAELGKAQDGAGVTEGFYPEQMVDVITEILRLEAQGLTQNAAFKEIDGIVWDALRDTEDPDNSDIFKYFYALDEADIKLDEATAVLQSASAEPIPPNIIKKIDHTLSAIKPLLNEYYLLRQTADKLRGNIPVQVKLFDKLDSFYDFCRKWGEARDHYLICKWFNENGEKIK